MASTKTSSQPPVQKRLSIYNWNPGSRREKEDAFEKQITEKWYIVTLQEASDDVAHDILQENLGERYNVVSRASFRRQPRNGPTFFTVMSLHINNNYAKQRGIGKKLLLTIRAIMQEEHVHLVAGDFNGAAWRLSDGNNPQPTSTLEEAFADTDLPMSLGATPLWGPGALPCEWTDVWVFLSLRTLLKNGRSVCMELSLFTTRSSASVHKIKVAIMRCGCTWTMLTTSMLSCHEGNTSSGSSSKKGLVHTRLTCKYSQSHTNALLTTSTTNTNTTSTLQHDSTQDDNGLALCVRVILDSEAHRWVQAGHPRYTVPEREGRGWPTTDDLRRTTVRHRYASDKRALRKQVQTDVLRSHSFPVRTCTVFFPFTNFSGLALS